MRPLVYLNRFLTALLKSILPYRCPLCDEFILKDLALCEACVAGVQRLEGDAQFLALKKVWFTRCRSAFAYEGHLRSAIHSYKYSEKIQLERFFVRELFAEMGKLETPDVIIPVPLHLKRLRLRGFNQAALIANGVGKLAKIKVLPDLLKRVKYTDPQVELDQEARLENIKNAFEISVADVRKIKNKNILLIDDVMTTGATLNECARVLTHSGASSVSGLTIARTIM